MSIEVKGLSELAKKLAKLGGTDTAISNGTREAARIVNNSAKELCPVDNGNLRASLHTDYNREGSKHIGSVLTNVEYAAYVEFGTGPKGNGTYPYELPGGDPLQGGQVARQNPCCRLANDKRTKGAAVSLSCAYKQSRGNTRVL